MKEKNDVKNDEIEILEVVDLELYAKEGKVPPKANKYKIKIDKNVYEVTVSSMTGRKLLELAKKTPVERYMIRKKFHGGQAITIGYDEEVDFRTPGIEKFMTIPLDQTEG